MAEVCAIVVASEQGMDSMARQWFARGGGPDVALFAPSQRVAARARELGFTRVTDLGSAAPQAVVQALQGMSENT